jgi:nucleoside-diphosphate-sugar epimerase
MKQVLLIGGLGYVGSWIAKSLGGQYRIRATSRNQLQSPYRHLFDEVVTGNPTDFHFLERAMKDVDTVVHLASPPDNEMTSTKDEIVQQHLEMSKAVLGATLGSGIRKLIYVSTLQVFGDNLSGTITIDTPCKPNTAYGLGHLLAEQLFSTSLNATDKQLHICRLSNGFGYPPSNAGGAWRFFVNDICNQARRDGVIRIRSRGTSTRDFIPMSSIGSTIAALVVSERLDQGTSFIASGHSLTLLQMATRVASVCKSVLGYDPQIETNQQDTQPPLKYSLHPALVTPSGDNFSLSSEKVIAQMLEGCDPFSLG